VARASDRTGIRQPIGVSPEARAVVCADAVIADPGAGPAHVRLAIDAALTDYRRAFVRRLVAAGVARTLVWTVMRDLPLDAAVPAALALPLGPELA
jgi:hypothetical protein